jgi:uncharacterized integral membrane protein
MNNKRAFVFLLWVVRGVTVCLTFLLFYSIFIHFFTVNGKFEVVYDFGQDSEYWMAVVYFTATLVGCAVAFLAGTLAVRLLMKG